jgi:hypothetical protein
VLDACFGKNSGLHSDRSPCPIGDARDATIRAGDSYEGFFDVGVDCSHGEPFEISLDDVTYGREAVRTEARATRSRAA